MSKPMYVYHGSQYFFDVVCPQQARGATAKESQYAIYAAETIEEAIPFALPIRWYPDDPTGKKSFSCKTEKPTLNTAVLTLMVWDTYTN